jgi:hypothetical protein
MTTQTAPSRSNRFLRLVLRLLMVIACGLVLGVLAYMGLVFAANRILNPLQANTERLGMLETGQALDHQQQDERLAQFSDRLAALERQRAAADETLSELQNNTAAVEKAVQDQTARLKELDTLRAELDGSTSMSSYVATEVMGMRFTQTAAEEPLAGLRRDLAVLQSMELLNRSRLYMLQANFGIAAEDARAARQALDALRGQVPDYQEAALEQWIARIDLALSGLPASPVTAADDLEIAWRMMSAGLPGPSTPTPAIPPEAGTPTPTAFFTITAPVPGQTVTPSVFTGTATTTPVR